MWEKEKFYRCILKRKLNSIFNIFFLYFIFTSISLADIQKNIINKLTATKTLSFDFKQKISDKEEIGKCFIKYPLLMKCNYQNLKQKTIISNGIKVSIIKKKYKKIYSYPIKSTPLFFILKKEKIMALVRNTQPTIINSNLIEFEFTDKKKNKLKILFDKNSLNFKGWETEDAYSNNVSFIINNLITNNQIVDSFFKIPSEDDL
jgi:outer membrane lipoprotein-sorting protein